MKSYIYIYSDNLSDNLSDLSMSQTKGDDWGNAAESLGPEGVDGGLQRLQR